MEKKCPYCGAETRPDDNYCLHCGNPLPPATPSSASQQPQATIGDATLAAPDDWAAAIPNASPSGGNWPSSGGWSEGGATVADNALEQQMYHADNNTIPAPQTVIDRIESPARFILRADNGDIVQEYPLDKTEIAIGRAPTSDILLSKDKLTSRRHATVHYENGQYLLRDERSANGTFVNGQQIEEMVPQVLHDGDHVGIGEHELIFRSFASSSNQIEEAKTIATPFDAVPVEPTFRTQQDDLATVATTYGDDFGTRDGLENDLPAVPPGQSIAPPTEPEPQEPAAVPNTPEPAPAVPVVTSYVPPEPTVNRPAPVLNKEYTEVPVLANPSTEANGVNSGVTLSRLTSLAQPNLPDMTALMAALSTLDGQIMSLQEQFNATQESMRNHDSEIVQTTNQLRSGLRQVCERMDRTIADVARSREALSWAELTQLMEDVMNNPRDIEYVTKLARKARELNKIFQIHQNVLNTMAECNSLLRSLIGDDK